MPSLRRSEAVATVRDCIRASQRDDFRIIELNTLATHIHLLVEADNAAALTEGMRSVGVRLATVTVTATVTATATATATVTATATATGTATIALRPALAFVINGERKGGGVAGRARRDLVLRQGHEAL